MRALQREKTQERWNASLACGPFGFKTTGRIVGFRTTIWIYWGFLLSSYLSIYTNLTYWYLFLNNEFLYLRPIFSFHVWVTCRFWSARYHWRGSYSPGKITEPDYLVKQYVCLSRGRGSVPMKNQLFSGNMWICDTHRKRKPLRKQDFKVWSWSVRLVVKTPWQWSKCDPVWLPGSTACTKGEWELWVWQPKTTVVSLSQPVCCSTHVDFYYFSGVLAL